MKRSFAFLLLFLPIIAFGKVAIIEKKITYCKVYGNVKNVYVDTMRITPGTQIFAELCSRLPISNKCSTEIIDEIIDFTNVVFHKNGQTLVMDISKMPLVAKKNYIRGMIYGHWYVDSSCLSEGFAPSNESNHGKPKK